MQPQAHETREPARTHCNTCKITRGKGVVTQGKMDIPSQCSPSPMKEKRRNDHNLAVAGRCLNPLAAIILIPNLNLNIRAREVDQVASIAVRELELGFPVRIVCGCAVKGNAHWLSPANCTKAKSPAKARLLRFNILVFLVKQRENCACYLPAAALLPIDSCRVRSFRHYQCGLWKIHYRDVLPCLQENSQTCTIDHKQ